MLQNIDDVVIMLSFNKNLNYKSYNYVQGVPIQSTYIKGTTRIVSTNIFISTENLLSD